MTSTSAPAASTAGAAHSLLVTRGYQHEMLNESLHKNIIIALDTGSGKTYIAVLRLKHEMEKEQTKLSWFIAPTVALCAQQKLVLEKHIPVSVGIISGANEPNQWKNVALWERVLHTHRIMVSTPQVLLDALRHGYINLGRDISLIIFDEAHHAVDKHPYNRIMKEFYFQLPVRHPLNSNDIVRPMILGLTASPIYGGNVDNSFRAIEGNLDCVIRAPQLHRSELARYVHRPVFRHIKYSPSNDNFSTNLASLSAMIKTLDINDDPYVIDLKRKLADSAPGSPDYHRYDQKLSKVVQKHDSFTHKGLRDFERTANDICYELGGWAADWFVWNVIDRAKQASNPFNNIMASWRVSEKAYLLSVLNQIRIISVSYFPDDIADDSSDKVKVLIDCLMLEKAETESLNDVYSCIVFVQRRDAVLALAEVIKHHPYSKGVFNIGILLGTSDSSRRHSMMDITRVLVKDSQEDTLSDFRDGEKNLIISTAVAEEGIDIQACGSVIRWDPPHNMASWAQSRGRARKRRSTFTVMFEEGSQKDDIAKWEALERQMVKKIYDPLRNAAFEDDCMIVEDDEENDDWVYEVASTGAKLTLHSAISHLTHFCSVIPNSVHADNQPLFERDPPEFPEGWHAFSPEQKNLARYRGPYGCTLTLPRALPLPERQFSVERIYKTIVSARRHAAFNAYAEFHQQGLLDDNLLPIANIIEPQLEEEVLAMLADVEKREGLAKVSRSIDPWTPEDFDSDTWFYSELTLEGFTPLLFFTKSEVVDLDFNLGPVLYRPGRAPQRTSVHPLGIIMSSDNRIALARHFTRNVFWSLNHSRMDWENLDFSYLFLPINAVNINTAWNNRREWLEKARLQKDAYPHHLAVKVDQFIKEFGYTSDMTLIQRHIGSGRPFKFIYWRYAPLPLEEEEQLRKYYAKQNEGIDIEITYPLLAVQPYPPRTNFLIPIEKEDPEHDKKEPPTIFLLPKKSGVIFLSEEEAEYAFLLPSVLRFLSMSMTANSLRKTLFQSTPLVSIPLSLLTVAITAPSSNDRHNYQRLETLGDAVLKFVVGVQLLAEYPLWHEGYLTKKKDHAVANVRLAKEDLKCQLYRWIFQDSMLGRKWKPKYFNVPNSPESPAVDRQKISNLTQIDSPTFRPERTAESSTDMEGIEDKASDMAPKLPKQNKKKSTKNSQQLSTKVLADVVESIIGAAYFHGGLTLGYECVKYFDLGLKWEPIPVRISQILRRVEDFVKERASPVVLQRQMADVESMLGYTFKRKLLLVEALTHASYQNDDIRASSYERMEFLGDSILDLIVNDYLYRAPGKNFTPGHIFLRKSAVVNAHILAYVCLNTSIKVEAFMPVPNAVTGAIEEIQEEHEIHLFKCLLHSSSRILEDQINTFSRFKRTKPEIEQALTEGVIFPWAALTKLQAPKFLSDIVESLIGAVFLDSEGSMEIIEKVLKKLGIMSILEHIVTRDVDVLHPVSRLSLWSQGSGKTIEYDIGQEGGKVYCRILVDGTELKDATKKDEFRGKASQEEVKFAAAETAIKVLRLRDVGVGYEKTKKKKPRKEKGN